MQLNFFLSVSDGKNTKTDKLDIWNMRNNGLSELQEVTLINTRQKYNNSFF